MIFTAMNPTRWSPAVFGANAPVRSDLDRLFRGLLKGMESFSEPEVAVFPRLNVWSTEECLFVECALAGYTLDEIQVSVQGDRLWLAGEPKAAEETDTISYHRRERVRPRFQRSLTLPVAIDADAVTASLANGLLTIELPKAKESRPRQIQVKAAGK
jgi:HSP20 family protein